MSLRQLCHQLQRRRWLVTGQVQGVGFRPFVYRVARQLGLAGWVRNQAGGVVIECQGDASSLERFEQEVRANHPPLASIRLLHREERTPNSYDRGFDIIDSAARGGQLTTADVTVDAATCPACLREILSPADRRHRHALANCTDCGPRFSIVRRVPYDRSNTTMSGFAMCPTCRAEYTNPADRRFHAQPIACHDCGPTLKLVGRDGAALADDPIDAARDLLIAGTIVAIKGLGGFHLAVRADDEQAVKRLRDLKKRDHKPFALMVASIQSARRLVTLSDPAVAAMRSPACPIVLAPRIEPSAIAPSVAPGNYRLGVMLPYTPVHHLLFGSPSVIPPLVMTSGNVSDDPLIIDDADALDQLGSMSDAILLHERPIQRGVDDSVLLDAGDGALIPVRRSRGYVPCVIELPIEAPSAGLCVGAELKNTVAVVRGRSVVLSQHLGDLTHPRAFENFVQIIDDLRDLFDVRPAWVAHDLHPMYLSTAYARKLWAQLDVPVLAVQHHHAHAASLLAEHGLSQRILAIVCDGTGFGTDGTIWGGELLVGDLHGFDRLARLRPLRLPGGDAAARDITRCAMALLYQASGGCVADDPAARRLVADSAARAMLARMIRDQVSCATSSGAGRFFDGIAALLGLCSYNQFEAQAAVALESAAHRGQRRRLVEPLFKVHQDDIHEIDLSPLIGEIVLQLQSGAPVDDLAWLFHEQFAQAWASAAREASARVGVKTVGLTGGVFCNAWLTRRLTGLLRESGLKVLRHRVVPPNDGGIALGQAAIAAARMNGSTRS
jgi:hydrogenase maturation protein HypF